MGLLLLSILICLSFEAIAKTDTQNKASANFVCSNGGTVRGDKCECPEKYSGEYCQREKHCLGYERKSNGSCILCKDGFDGPDCDIRRCKNDGEQQSDGSCKCKSPHVGEFCDQLSTASVYLHYNQMIRSLGPIGAIIIIPMVIINYGCSKLAAKRQVKRVERSFGEQNKTDVSKHAIENLLKQ